LGCNRQAYETTFRKTSKRLSDDRRERQAVTKDLTSSSKFSGSFVLTLQPLPSLRSLHFLISSALQDNSQIDGVRKEKERLTATLLTFLPVMLETRDENEAGADDLACVFSPLSFPKDLRFKP